MVRPLWNQLCHVIAGDLLEAAVAAALVITVVCQPVRARSLEYLVIFNLAACWQSNQQDSEQFAPQKFHLHLGFLE